MTSTLAEQTKPPFRADVGVCALVPEDWSYPWRSRHHVMSRLARYFQVVWVDPAPGWRDVLKNRRSRSGVAGEPTLPSFVRYEPEIWLPKFLRPQWLASATFSTRVRRARSLLRRRGCTTIVLYLWRPEYAGALAVAPFDLTCYHIADEYSFSAIEVAPDTAEIRLVADVDQVIIHSPGLIERLGGYNPNTTFVPNGVDYAAFATRAAEPHDLASIPRPRIGYNGWIKHHLDWTLVRQLSERNPTWSFVFVGPLMHQHLRPTIEELSRRPNVHFLGEKSARELATYPQHFDVCVMPYTLDDYSAHFIYPLKLHEYLASGSPGGGNADSQPRALRARRCRWPSRLDEWSRAISSELRDDQTSADATRFPPEYRARARLERPRGSHRQHPLRQAGLQTPRGRSTKPQRLPRSRRSVWSAAHTMTRRGQRVLRLPRRHEQKRTSSDVRHCRHDWLPRSTRPTRASSSG